MFDKIQKSILNGLNGKHIHVNPFKALEGLNSELAKEIPPKGGHSCWQILYHIVYWQDFMLPHLRKEEVAWPRDNKESWPENDSLKGEDDWKDLITRFKKGVEEAEEITKAIDSFDNLPSDPKVPEYAALMVFVQHNAYHLGQIVTTRQAIGAWPPPDHKSTF